MSTFAKLYDSSLKLNKLVPMIASGILYGKNVFNRMGGGEKMK